MLKKLEYFFVTPGLPIGFKMEPIKGNFLTLYRKRFFVAIYHDVGRLTKKWNKDRNWTATDNGWTKSNLVFALNTFLSWLGFLFSLSLSLSLPHLLDIDMHTNPDTYTLTQPHTHTNTHAWVMDTFSHTNVHPQAHTLTHTVPTFFSRCLPTQTNQLQTMKQCDQKSQKCIRTQSGKTDALMGPRVNGKPCVFLLKVTLMDVLTYIASKLILLRQGKHSTMVSILASRPNCLRFHS